MSVSWSSPNNMAKRRQTKIDKRIHYWFTCSCGYVSSKHEWIGPITKRARDAAIVEHLREHGRRG